MADAPLPIPGARQQDRRPGLGYAMALVAASLFAVNGTVSKIALTGTELSAVDYTQARASGAFLLLALALAVIARDRLRIARADLPFLAFYGAFSFTLVQWLYFVAIEHLPIGIALLIQFSGIVLVALWARLVWQAPVRPRVWAALSLTLVGLALVSELWLGWTLDTVGVVAAVGAAIALAVYLLAGEHAVQARDPLGVL
jgi:drug/metabolite transporter (DMT)-like permease